MSRRTKLSPVGPNPSDPSEWARMPDGGPLYRANWMVARTKPGPGLEEDAPKGTTAGPMGAGGFAPGETFTAKELGPGADVANLIRIGAIAPLFGVEAGDDPARIARAPAIEPDEEPTGSPRPPSGLPESLRPEHPSDLRG